MAELMMLQGTRCISTVMNQAVGVTVIYNQAHVFSHADEKSLASCLTYVLF